MKEILLIVSYNLLSLMVNLLCQMSRTRLLEEPELVIEIGNALELAIYHC